MSDIAEIERRISFALERIARAAERAARRPVPAAAVPPGPAPANPAPAAAASAAQDEIAALKAALAAERSANAKLTDRVRGIKERQDGTVTQLERKLARLTDQLDIQGLELQRLRKANIQLAEANRALTEADGAGAADPAAVNRAMSAELEALRADRRAEMAEIEEVLAALSPLISEKPHA